MRVLFLTHRVPFAPNRGDRIRAFHTLRFLKARGIPVCLVSLAHEGDERTAGDGLADLADAVHVVQVPTLRNRVRGAMRLGSQLSLTHLLLDSPELPATLERVKREFQPDVVLALCSSMARFAMRPPLDDVPFVLDLLDVDSFKWEALARVSSPPLRWIYAREARLLCRFEVAAAHAARATVVVSEKEAASLRTLDPTLSPVVVPLGVDLDGFRNPGAPSTAHQAVFTGVFNYRPNLDGARWLIDEVWPIVRRTVPDAGLTLAGSGAGAALIRKARHAGIVVTGGVPDVRPYLWAASVCLAPLHTARGVQNKVLEGVAAGLPAIVTPAVFDGLPAEVRPACEVASTSEAFAAAVVRWLTCAPPQRAARVAAAPLLALRWEHCLTPLVELLETAAQGILV